MTIRQKFLLTMAGITICLSFIFYSIIAPLVNKKFELHEMDSATNKLKRVQAVFNYQIQHLEDFVYNWANWNEACTFISGHDKNHVVANIMRNTFVNTAGIDLLLIFDANGNLVHSKFFSNRIGPSQHVDKSLVQAVTLHGQLLKQSGQQKKRSGIVQDDDRYLAIAASPIYDRTCDNSFRGTLIMGQLLDKQQIELLQDITLITLYSIDLYPIESGPEDVIQASLALSHSSSSYYTKIISKKLLKGYTILNDISGKSLLMLVASFDRVKHKKHHDDLPFLLKSVFLCSIGFGIVCFFFIDILISRRLSTIIFDINQIEKKGAHTTRVRESAINDELGKLSRSINHMLDANETLENYKAKTRRLEALTTFAAGATHELATPLSTIAVASGEILQDLLHNRIIEEELYDDVFLIREQVDRCKYILSQMVVNAGMQLAEGIVFFSSSKLIEVTLKLFPQTTIQRIEVNNRLGDQPIAMPFDSLCRVLRGILRNSLDASETEQTIVLSCYENDTHILFTTSDQGKGMDTQTLKQAVDPFFTTKQPGENLGLGLYLAHSLANRFGGDLEISSSPGEGTSVTLSFAKVKIYV